MRARGQRVDERARRADVAQRADQAVEDRLRAAELLRPQRGVGGHPEHLGRPEHRLVAEQHRLAGGEQRVALLGLAEREQRLGGQQRGEEVEAGSLARGDGVHPLRGRGHPPQRPVDHVRDRRLEQEAAGAHAVEALDPLRLAHERLAGAQRVAEAHLRPRGHRAQVGLQQRVDGEPAALLGELERARQLAGDRGRAGRLEQRPRPLVVVDVELPGAGEPARGGGEGGAPAGVAGRVHQRLRDAGVGHRAGGGLVPGALGAAVGERLGERAVRVAALGRARAVVDGGAHQRVVELDLAAAQREQAGRLGRLERVGGQAGVGERAGDHVGAHRLGAGGDEQPVARRLGQRVDAAPERALERLAGAQRAEREVAPRALVGAQPARDLAQRQRVARRRGEQLVDHRGREAVGLGGQHAARARLVEPFEPQRVEAEVAGLDALAVAQPEQQHHALGVEPPGGEQQRLARRLVEPLQVVGDRQHGLALGRRREQAQHRGGDREAIGDRRRLERQRAAQRLRLDRRDLAAQVEQRRQQLGERRERQLGLRLDPARPQNAQPVGVVGGVAQQRRLAHAGLAVHEQRRAAPLPRRLDHAPEPSALLVTSDQQGLGVYGCARRAPRATA